MKVLSIGSHPYHRPWSGNHHTSSHGYTDRHQAVLMSASPISERAHRPARMGMICSDPHPECPDGVEPEEGDVCILVGLQNGANLHHIMIIT